MKKNNYLFVLLSTIVFSLYSCGEKYTVIEILSPENGQTFQAGSTIEVNAKILHDGDAITCEKLIVTTNTNDTIINFFDIKFAGEYMMSKSFTAEADTQYKIEVSAKGGHGNWTYKTILVSSN